jgi:flavorubredoxin
MTSDASSSQPYQIAKDTFVIPEFHPVPGAPSVFMNSMVIRGAEPVIVDTGNPFNREQWLAAAWSIVDPEDVRWIYLSHDDVDHVGNLEAVLEACPQATVITDWFMTERLSQALIIPPERSRWISAGDRVDVGDRTLVSIRPPLFDSPTTKGVYDSSTGVFWAVDCFAVPVFEPVTDVRDIAPGMWEGMLPGMNRSVTPWLEWIDEARWQSHVDEVQSLGAQVIASAHSPAIYGDMVADAFNLLRQVPTAAPAPLPGQADLDAMLAAAMAASAQQAA